jgi:hypothetical protein
MFAFLLATLISLNWKSLKSSNRNFKRRGPKPLSGSETEIEPNKDGCYDAFVALKNALTVASDNGNEDGTGGNEEGTGGNEGGTGGNEGGTGGNEGGTGGNEGGTGLRRNRVKRRDLMIEIARKETKVVQPLATTSPYADFAAQCPTTVANEECAPAYSAVSSLAVSSQGIIDTFVEKCNVAAPPSGDAGYSNFGSISYWFLLAITLTCFYYFI